MPDHHVCCFPLKKCPIKPKIVTSKMGTSLPNDDSEPPARKRFFCDAVTSSSWEAHNLSSFMRFPSTIAACDSAVANKTKTISIAIQTKAIVGYLCRAWP